MPAILFLMKCVASMHANRQVGRKSVGFKVGLAQINVVLGDVTANLQKHLDWAGKAKAARVDLLVFPELSLTGYMTGDLVSSVAMRVEDSAALQELQEASKGIDIVTSFVEEDARHRLYISAAYMSQGRIVHLHRKVYLWTYGLGWDGKFFDAGDSLRAFDTRLGRMGILICEDYWHMSTPYVLWLDGADFLICLAAQPGYGIVSGDGLLGVNHTKAGALITYARLLTDYVLHCNRVGFEEGIAYSGDSFVAGPDGLVAARAGQFDEELLLAEIDTGVLRRQRILSPMLRDERPDLILHEMSRLAARGGER